MRTQTGESRRKSAILWVVQGSLAALFLFAGGLVIIMVGATVLTVASGQVSTAFVPAVVGMLCASVAYVRATNLLRLGTGLIFRASAEK
jgi:hypothetical protein